MASAGTGQCQPPFFANACTRPFRHTPPCPSRVPSSLFRDPVRTESANEIELESVGGDRFVGSRGTVTLVRKASGEVAGLTISNRRLRRLQADRLM